MRRTRKILVWMLAGAAAVALLAVLAGFLVVQTPWFRDKVRERIVYEIENATGGRVELAAFDFDWRTLIAGVRGLVIHGAEGPQEAPLFRADYIRVGLRIISVTKKQVDLQFVTVSRPQANIIVYEDGRTNLPKPRVARQRTRSPLETILDLAIKRFDVTGGTITTGIRKLPLEVHGENLRAQIFYETAPARYRGTVAFRSLDLKPGDRPAIALDVDTQLVLERDRLSFESIRLTHLDSSLQASGALDHFAAPRLELGYTARINVADATAGIALGPLMHRGIALVSGRASAGGGEPYRITGSFAATGLEVRERGIHVQNIRVNSAVAITPGRIEFSGLRTLAFGGLFEGRAEILGRRFNVEGEARGFSLQDATHVEVVRRVEWNGTASGPVRLRGEVAPGGKLVQLLLNTTMEIAPAPGDNPVNGSVDLTYDHASGAVSFGPSVLNTRFSNIRFSGVLGRQVRADVLTTNLDDAQPAIALFSTSPPPEMPVKLVNGTAKFSGTVNGALKAPTIHGRAEATNFVWEGRQFDHVIAEAVVSRSGVVAQNAVITRQRMRASGDLRVSLDDWKADRREPIWGKLKVQSPAVADVLSALDLAGDLDLTGGPVSADVMLGGDLGNIEVSGHARALNVVFYGQPIDSVEGDARYTDTFIDVATADLVRGPSRARISLRFDHAKGDWQAGRVRFDAASRGIYLAQLNAVQQRVAGLEGRIDVQIAGEVNIDKSGFRPVALNGWAGLRDAGVNGEQLGSLLLSAATRNAALNVNLDGEVAGAKVTGTSTLSLQGDYTAHGRAEFTSLRFSTLLAKLRKTPSGFDLPFNGSASGVLEVSGSTIDPKTWKATVQLPAVDIRPVSGPRQVSIAPDLILRNTGPVLVEIDPTGARVRRFELRARDTSLSVSGRVGFGVKNPWDLRVQGGVDLALLRDFDTRLYSSGSVALDVSIRGALEKPDVYGRVDLRRVSANFAGFPNGIDNANGVLFLYRDRAMIETLTAGSGGGTISASGFVTFAPEVTFHLQAQAKDVRLRYPEGVSSTSDASLTLTGTLDRSVLAGEITITRVGFNPRSDLGSMLAGSAEPVPAPVQPSAFRQGLRFDVHIVTAPQVRLETKLTKDVQGEANLRLRGDATRPALLGRVLISQGDVIFFGNKYTISSGQILFVNASRIEPTVSLDLETRARGVEVTLHVSGPANKLSVNYRSDPPLPFSEIVALLTTGREPGLNAETSVPQTQIGQNWQQAGAGALVSQAIATPIAGRLQRFFGVSRLKIDPQITGTTMASAAARVTVEQNVTSNLTFTYITDLSRAQAQTVRIEWDFTNHWSGVALREENGQFGIDFVYRKQLK